MFDVKMDLIILHITIHTLIIIIDNINSFHLGNIGTFFAFFVLESLIFLGYCFIGNYYSKALWS